MKSVTDQQFHWNFWACMSIAVFAFAVSTTAETWQNLGPSPLLQDNYNGRCSAVIASPTDPNKYYVAGATGGVWRTTDGGQSWTPLTDFMPISSIGALALDPSNEDIVYAGTGEANFANHSIYGLGLYKSVDGGDNWEVLAEETFAGRTFSRIVVSYANSQVLFASVMHAGGFPARVAAKGHPLKDGPVGIFRSIDGGVTWEHLLNGLPNQAGSDVWMHPTYSNILYAAIGDIFGVPENGIYKSTNGGDSWTKLEGGLPTSNVGRITLAVAPSNPQRLYAIITEEADAFGGDAETLDVYRTVDGGTTWGPTNSGNFQATYGWFLSTAIVHPHNDQMCFVGGLSLLRTGNGGGSYVLVTPPHVDMHGLAWDAAGRLLCANDGGLHRSDDNGNSWEPLNAGLSVFQFYPGLSVHPNREDYILGGTQDNGTNLRATYFGETQWYHRLGGDGGCTTTTQGIATFALAELQGTGNVYRAINVGSFNYVGHDISGADRVSFVAPIVSNPVNVNTKYYGTQRVWRSLNNGLDWSPISGDLTSGFPYAIRSLVFSRSNADVGYAVTNDGRVLVSTDGGLNWDLKLEGVPGWPRLTREIAIDPDDEATVYLAVAWFGEDQIRRSTDYGTTWEVLDGNLPDVPANSVAVYRDAGLRIVLLGTDGGVWISSGDETRWSKYGEGLPNVPIMDVVVDEVYDRIILGSLGRGAWLMPVPNVADPDGDGDVDVTDLQGLQNCFSGEKGAEGFLPPSESCLTRYDFDRDGDVDQFELSHYVGRLSDPQ